LIAGWIEPRTSAAANGKPSTQTDH